MKPQNETRYFGKICAKHPELAGERMISTRGCVACKRERWVKSNRARKSTAVGVAYAERKRESQKDRRLRERIEVFTHYGQVCSECGFSDSRALTIDHTNQRGAEHKKPDGRRYTGVWLYRWLIKNGMPSGFRTLCANCQMVVYQEANK